MRNVKNRMDCQFSAKKKCTYASHIAVYNLSNKREIWTLKRLPIYTI